MKIAITGGSGFIGGRLAALLGAQGHQVVILDTQAPEPVDVTDRGAVIAALKGVDVIYHLAAAHRDDVKPVEKYYEVNVGGAENIVAAAEKHNIKTIIFTSTVAVYGLDAGESREDSPAAPFNDYGRSKRQSEDVFQAWAESNPLNTLTMIRLVATFGPGNRGNIYNLMNQIYRGRFVMIGRGENRKSIAYVENVSAFLAHCLGFRPGVHLYNYADKPDLTMHELVHDVRHAMGRKGPGPKLPYPLGIAGGKVFDALANVTGKTFPVSEIRVRKFCANTVVNADKLKETGFVAPYTLQQGFAEMVSAEFETREAA